MVKDLYAPFPRPSVMQALTQLTAAAARSAENGDPDDALDAYGGRSEWLSGFEAEVAAALGKERALFFPTGVAAQNAALAVHAELPDSLRQRQRGRPTPLLMMHATSHLARYEENAYKELLGLNSLIVGDATRVLAAKDIEHQLSRLAAVGQGPCMILVETPMRELGCVAPSWEELVEMRRLADQYNVPLHLDGARLWEIGPYYEATSGKSLQEVAALFDTVYVSFYKGLGALTGAMLLGTERFCKEAMPWRRRLGANPYTVMPYALSCRDAYRSHSQSFEARWRKLERLAPKLAAAAQAAGGTWRTVPEAPLSCQVHVCIGPAHDAAALDAARDAVEAERGVRLYGRLVGETPPGSHAVEGGPPEQYFELSLGPAHVELDDAVFVEAWTAFFEALRATASSTGEEGGGEAAA